ncbi:glycosyltransferase family 4 protein [Candidatus Thiosymbion oneisti]|uniref:glycosyltransferase family 4 protein n=1 Tax=Candidatus Thiosymbion oneisti TaxID=589554 RepID=UPI000B7D5C21|nr:glycosyltransferase family 4 protein [Candidatus Thiosymbion oneisti]
MKTPENIGFVSTRFAGTDGVSLEAAKWAEVLWQDQHVSYWYGGVLDRDPEMSMCVPEAFFGHSENRWINERLWDRTSRGQEASRRIRELAEYLKGTLYEYRERFELDILILQNVLTIPMHIPLGVAVTEFLLETRMPAIAHHHDFHWERQRFQISAVGDYLEMAFPPRIPHLQHVVINQAAKDQLGWRKGISSLLIPNVLDYENPPDPIDDYAADVREEIGLAPGDLLILQPTRVIPRKGIEHAIHLLRRIEDSRCKLVVSHAAGDEGLIYCKELCALARDEKVELILFEARVADRRQLNEDGRKIYVLKDLYPHADLVTFPSLYEGFGNALLEAIYFRKPLVIGNYSVYSRDIVPKGISLPTVKGFIDRDLVEETRRILEDQDYREQLVEHNYRVAERYFSYRVLRNSLRLIIANIRNLTE